MILDHNGVGIPGTETVQDRLNQMTAKLLREVVVDGLSVFRTEVFHPGLVDEEGNPFSNWKTITFRRNYPRYYCDDDQR